MKLDSMVAPLVESGRRLAETGVFAGTEGNLSQRYPDGTRSDDGEFVRAGAWIITGRATHKHALGPDQFALFSRDQESLAGPEPSSEWRMHRAIYDARSDVQAIVHAHPPFATALALAGVAIGPELLPGLTQDLGAIPLIAYATPGSDEAAALTSTQLGTANGALLARHGALTVGDTHARAVARMESLEQAAKSIVLARLLGRGEV